MDASDDIPESMKKLIKGQVRSWIRQERGLVREMSMCFFICILSFTFIYLLKEFEQQIIASNLLRIVGTMTAREAYRMAVSLLLLVGTSAGLCATILYWLFQRRNKDD